ncbi:MAG: DNA mismatch repair endonuclease MutL [Candidatus Eisenbacteria bacterium]|nr:DNA mismatch repair endonuclease MutL [Candidatus Eisenbacteria bacterium]
MPETEAQKIQRLPHEVVGRIAAGEMITRPTAALKELLENALDAEATRIRIDVREALDRHLEIQDDGRGIPRAELALALERYATSKISREEDLLRVSTLGFRGEALASIAEISHLTLISRCRGSEDAWQLRASGGQTGALEAAARAPGTTVRVEELFFNTPVRKRFLKSPAAELRLARATVTAFAVAAPGIAWAFFQDGKPLFEWAAAPDLRARLIEIHGARLVEGLLPVEAREGGVAVRGFVGVPELARAGRYHQTLFVNGRAVASPYLAQALRQGFGDLIPGHQNPWAVLFVTVPPDRLDVNLHPTKQEVRFLDERMVFGCVQRAVHQAVAKLLPRLFLGTERSPATGSSAPAPPRQSSAGAPARPARWGAIDGREATAAFYGTAAGSGEGILGESPKRAAPEDAEAFQEAMGLQGPLTDTAGAGGGSPPDLVSLWQLHNRYVLAQTRKGLLIIDQHAAHERILYEQILARMQREPAGGQQLLFPVVQELTEPESRLFGEIKGSLLRMGFDVEEFGEESVVVRGVPPLWRARSEASLLRDLLAEAEETGLREGETLEGLARAFACRAAIKSGTPLSMEEMNRLVDELFRTAMPHGDPHGRPTFVFVSLLELNRRFGRGGSE